MKIGTTLRETNIHNILELRDLGLIDFIEIVPSFYFRFNRPLLLKEILDKVDLPYSFHFVDHSPLSATLNKERIYQSQKYLEKFSPVLVSDHLTSCENEFSVDMNVPIPIRSTYLERYIENLTFLKNELRKSTSAPIIMEHVPRYFKYKEDNLSFNDFINTVSDQSQTGILLDLHNLTCDQHNIEEDISDIISKVNLDAVYEVHLAGGEIIEGDVRYDSHSETPDISQMRHLEAFKQKDIYVNYEREHNYKQDEVIFFMKQLKNFIKTWD